MEAKKEKWQLQPNGVMLKLVRRNQKEIIDTLHDDFQSLIPKFQIKKSLKKVGLL